jgi:hypothetical protein
MPIAFSRRVRCFVSISRTAALMGAALAAACLSAVSRADTHGTAATGCAPLEWIVLPAAERGNLRLSFSGVGETPVHVRISDVAGVTWLNEVVKSAVVTASIPPGTYEVAATSGAQRAKRVFTICGRERYVGHFEWDVPTAERP